MAIAAAVYRPAGLRRAKEFGGADGRSNAHRRGYGGLDWQSKRKRTFNRDNYTCRMCGLICIPGHADAGRRPHCDHIVPKPAGGDEDGNLQTLCGRCHGAKTAKERKGGGKMIQNFLPIDRYPKRGFFFTGFRQKKFLGIDRNVIYQSRA